MHKSNKELLAENQALREQYNLAVAHSDELRNSLTFIFPHELRTPLNVILGFSQLLASRPPKNWPEPGMMHDIHKAIHDNALRLEHLIENYLVYVQLQLKDYASENKPRGVWYDDILIWTETLLTSLALKTAEKNGRRDDIQLFMIEASIRMSQKAIKKIVEELLDNAFKFSEPGTPVHMITHVSPTQWSLTISDQGRGMSVEHIANIGAFMQFERKHYEQQGSGLGLLLARRLTELHGGELTIESVPHQGTTVKVTVPVGGKFF